MWYFPWSRCRNPRKSNVVLRRVPRRRKTATGMRQDGSASAQTKGQNQASTAAAPLHMDEPGAGTGGAAAVSVLSRSSLCLPRRWRRGRICRRSRGGTGWCRHRYSSGAVWLNAELGVIGVPGASELPSFVAVEITKEVPALPEVADKPAVNNNNGAPRRRRRQRAGLIEIDLGSGRRVRVGRDVDAAALERVLDVLARR